MKKLLLLLLPLCILLNACATAPAEDEMTIAQLSNDRRSREAIMIDKDIEADINDELIDDNEIASLAHVNVNAYNGAVLVTGEAATEELKNKIIALIRVIDNVKLVHNNLAVAYPSDLDIRDADAQMTGNIKAALAQIRTIPDFDSAMVKVITENASVFLMGRMHRNEGNVVINVVRHQPGVKQIITVFEYLD